MQKITPFLWFDKQAEAAANFYVSIFKNSKILTISRYSQAAAQASGVAEGTALVVSFSLDGQTFNAINGGPIFKFTEAISFVVSCIDQIEVDHYWNALSEGGSEGQCGWLKDRYGLSWQIVPTILGTLMSDPDPKKSQNVMKAMLQMQKLNIPKLCM